MEIKQNKVSAASTDMPFVTGITSGGHAIIADEPAVNGGSDRGMTPHDLLLSALASCTCITIKMYAARKGWKLDRVQVDAVLERVVEAGIQTATVIQLLQLEGDLDAVMKARLLDIGGRCPVHKTLAPAMKIELKMKS